MSRFTEKVAVVTGAAKGIGAAIAKRLASEGAMVVVNYRTSRDEADHVVSEIEAAGGKAIAIQGRVDDERDVVNLFEQIQKSVGRVDVLVNNAGVYGFSPLPTITAIEFHRYFDTNVLGLLLVTKAAVPLFPSSGGSIVNISSIVSSMAPPAGSLYSASKGAVDSVTKSLAKELAPRKIRVNAVNPGYVQTEGTAGYAGSDFEKFSAATNPFGRIGQPSDISPSVAFLASDESGWITGETVYVSGGSGM